MKDLRKQRLEAELQRELSTMILRGTVKDPGLDAGMVTITRVKVTPDLAFAKVAISVFESDLGVRIKVMRALRRAAGFIQFQLGKNLRIRRVPLIHFEFDRSLRGGDEMVEFLEGQATLPPVDSD